MDTNIVIVLVVSVIAIIAAVLITAKVTTTRLKKNAEGTIGNAEEKAREIIDEALKTAENKKRESLLEVKEESIRTKNELDKEIKERRAEAQRYERRVQQKEENIDKKADAIEKREASLAAREETLGRMKEEVSKLNEQRVQELERISGLTSEQAKDYLLKIVEDEVKHESAVMIKEMESRAKEEADKKAKEYVVNAIQRCAADHVSETTISVVQLPNDEMKGRIIGREGRNIRALETLTGIDLIIDDTPEAVILSGFDPIRREIARLALEKLIVDGRVHPSRHHEEGPPRPRVDGAVRPGAGGGAGPEDLGGDHHQRPAGPAVRKILPDARRGDGPDPVGTGEAEAGPGLRHHPRKAGVRGCGGAGT